MKKPLLFTISNTSIQRDEAARVVAELYACTPSYVRKLISGTRKPKTKKGKEKAQAIIQAYWSYKNSKCVLKNNLIKAVQKVVAI